MTEGKIIIISDGDSVLQKRAIKRIHETFHGEEDVDSYLVIGLTSAMQALMFIRHSVDAKIFLIIEADQDHREFESGFMGPNLDGFEACVCALNELHDRLEQIILFTRNGYDFAGNRETDLCLGLIGSIDEEQNWHLVEERIAWFLSPFGALPLSDVAPLD